MALVISVTYLVVSRSFVDAGVSEGVHIIITAPRLGKTLFSLVMTELWFQRLLHPQIPQSYQMFLWFSQIVSVISVQISIRNILITPLNS